MSTDARIRLDDEQVFAAFGSRTLRIAADLADQIARNRETEQVLRAYLQDRSRQERPVLVTTPSPECVREARAYVRRRCAEHGVDGERCHTLELAASELVGNAVRHGRPPVAYQLVADGDELLLSVADADPRAPGDGEDCGLDCEGGRGLFLIAQTARAWGWEPAASGGKRVWARV